MASELVVVFPLLRFGWPLANCFLDQVEQRGRVVSIAASLFALAGVVVPGGAFSAVRSKRCCCLGGADTLSYP